MENDLRSPDTLVLDGLAFKGSVEFAPGLDERGFDGLDHT